MLKDVVNIIKNVALRHKGVRTFRYQGDDLNNAQNNHSYFQVYLDDVSLHQLNITTNVFKAQFELYILGFVDDDNPLLDVQNNAYTIACDIIAMIDESDEYDSFLNIHDYSILTLSRYTDDSSAGVRLTLELELTNPVNLCDLDENFNDEPYDEDDDKKIDIDVDEVGDITIKPITLPKNRNC